MVNQKRVENSKLEIDWLPRRFRTDDLLVNAHPRLAGLSASPPFGFLSAGGGYPRSSRRTARHLDRKRQIKPIYELTIADAEVEW